MSARSRALVYIVLIFCSGAVAGALLMNVAEHFWMHPAPSAAAPRPDPGAKPYVEEFRKELHLTDDQSRQLEEILDETMKQYSDLHTFSHHVRDDGIARIRAILNDEQRKQFDELLKKQEPEPALNKGRR